MVQIRKGCLTKFKKITILGILIIGILMSILAIANHKYPKSSSNIDSLSKTEITRIREIDHLRHTIGNEIWAGFGDQEIPIVLYNEAYVFLDGVKEPAIGWKKVPFTKQMGRPWNPIKINEEFEYFRQPIVSSDQVPEAFTVQVGDQYAASMTTKEWTGIKLTQLIRSELPAFLKPVFPYFLIRNKFNSDWHISAVIHESFHAFQAKNAFERVRSAEASNTFESKYPWKDPEYREAWLKERMLLGTVLKTRDKQKFKELTRNWLEVRDQRRSKYNDSKLSNYEQEREWLEGLAKYAEIRSWVLASENETYEPLPEMRLDADFDHYEGAAKNRKQEIKQLQSDLNFNETIFYYTGWAQAEILDRLSPDWKKEAFAPDTYLDELIRNTLSNPSIVNSQNSY